MAGTNPGALATLFVKSLESIENRKTHVLHLEKTLCFQTATFPPLQTSTNLFLAESRKNNGLKGDKRAFFARRRLDLAGQTYKFRQEGDPRRTGNDLNSTAASDFQKERCWHRKCWLDSSADFGWLISGSSWLDNPDHDGSRPK
jgi:hypothetical protein